MGAKVEIADAKGELFDYRLRRLAPAAPPRYEVTRLDTGAVYTVARNAAGLWECDCPAYKYRRRRMSLHCKHTLVCQRLHELVAALAQPEQLP